MKSVLQNWVQELSLKSQAVLLSSMRRPDFAGGNHIANTVRWLRSNILLDGNNGKGTFLKSSGLPDIRNKEVQEEFVKCSLHSALHIVHALEIVGYTHPDENIKSKANQAYRDLVNMFHMNIESKEEMLVRLSSEVESVCWK